MWVEGGRGVPPSVRRRLAAAALTVSLEQLRPSVRPAPRPARRRRAEITAITGITNEMVAGQSIDPADIARFAAPASLVIAHNANFDRRFLERLSDVFTTKPWACSQTEIDWAAEGYEGTKLAYLAHSAGFFYERHRAMHDCLATIELLSSTLPRTLSTRLNRLLEAARQPTWRIWAAQSPFELKDVLKARGYRWNGDPGPQPRAWFIDVPEARREPELHFLRTEIYRREMNTPGPPHRCARSLLRSCLVRLSYSDAAAAADGSLSGAMPMSTHGASATWVKASLTACQQRTPSPDL